MNLIVVGTNHRFSPIEIREALSFTKKRSKEALVFLREFTGLKNAVILSTCNRIEIYANTSEPYKDAQRLKEFLSRYHEISLYKICPYLYVEEGEDALRHLFRVCSGLDSLILGETQILGQVRSFLLEAEEANFVDEFLRKVFFLSFYIAKRVHTETSISEGKVSVGSVALDFIKQRIGSLSEKKILIIGVGKVTELVLRYLREFSNNVIFIANRTFERANVLAKKIGAKAARLDELKLVLRDADIVITATASPHFIIKKQTLEGIGHRLLIIDLAMPRDVEPTAKEIEGVELFYLEDLDIVIEKNLQRKAQEAEKARSIIDREVKILWRELLELEQDQVCLP